jgi:hypothetical protein
MSLLACRGYTIQVDEHIYRWNVSKHTGKLQQQSSRVQEKQYHVQEVEDSLHNGEWMAWMILQASERNIHGTSAHANRILLSC